MVCGNFVIMLKWRATRQSLTASVACASRVEGHYRRPYPLHLRGGWGTYELERPQQSKHKACCLRTMPGLRLVSSIYLPPSSRPDPVGPVAKNADGTR
jgi:hypothetical protein